MDGYLWHWHWFFPIIMIGRQATVSFL